MDNYDGPESYEELEMELSDVHNGEQPLEPRLFHQMRSKMVIVEAEMDEILDKEYPMTEKEKRTEWHRLKRVAISICDDYRPAECYEPIIEDHPATGYHRLGKDGMQHAGEDMRTPHLPKNRSYSAEELDHMSGDQDDLVDRNDCVTTTPLDAEGKRQVWKDHNPAYYIKGWSNNNDSKKEGINNQVDCMFKGQGNRLKQTKCDYEGDGSEDDREQMACNMTGQSWER